VVNRVIKRSAANELAVLQRFASGADTML